MPESFKNISKVNLRKSRAAVTFGDVVYAPGGVCGPHMQRDYQLVILHCGTLELCVNGGKSIVLPGQAILLTPNHREHFVFSRDTESHHSWCSIQPHAIPVKMRSLFRSLRKPAPFDSPLIALLKLGKTTFSGSAADEVLEDSFCLGIGIALLSGFAMVAQTGGVTRSSNEEALSRMEEFVSREYSKPLQLSHMASASGVSRQHLLKLCRDRQRMTPTDYLYAKRLEVAVDLLSHTGLSIGEIADRCGFANAFHFSRKFRRAYGKSPRPWRAQAWGDGK